MSDVIRAKRAEVTQFDPERYRLNDAALDFGIDEAKLIKNWPALEEAVDVKIDEQRKFVAWWRATVSVGHGGDRKLKDQGPGTRTLMSAVEAEDLTGMAKQRVSDLGVRLGKPDKYREMLLGVEYRAAMLEGAENVRGTTGTGENEWFTPPQYVEMARAVLGAIDLDPASNEIAQQVVQAERFYSKADNGLLQEWHGRVWLNPPYAQPEIAHFIGKLVAERNIGRVEAAVVLTHNYTDTAWFHELASVAQAICFTRGRVKFYEPDGAVAAPTQGQAFTYIGDDIDRFTEVFSAIGFVAGSIIARVRSEQP